MTQEPPPDGRVAKWILLLALFLALAARLAAGQEADGKQGGASLYEKAKRASVEILVDDHLAGTGWFADKGGLLFTASHVVGRPPHRIELLSPVAGRVSARLVAVDLGHDLALLQAEPREGGYPVLPLAEKLPPPGDDVFLFGTPIFRHAVLLPGMVANDELVFEYYTDMHVEVLHVAASVPGGVSGGPWLNRQGEVVGLQSGMMTVKTAPAGVVMVVPLDAVRELLKSRRNAATPTIGAALEETWQHEGEVLKRYPPRTEGLVVCSLQEDGPAARAGLKAFDVIVAAEGRKIRLIAEMLRVIRSKKPGNSLRLTILSPDGTGVRQVTVRLGRLEVGWPEAAKK